MRKLLVRKLLRKNQKDAAGKKKSDRRAKLRNIRTSALSVGAFSSQQHAPHSPPSLGPAEWQSARSRAGNAIEA